MVEKIMVEKILVALDHSDTSVGVFRRALELAEATGATLMLLHVHTPGDPGAPEPPFVMGVDYGADVSLELWEAYREQRLLYEQNELAHLAQLAQTAQARGVTAEYTFNGGHPGRMICDLARTWDADLVIVGRRGHSGLSEWVIGSVSNYVMHHAPCSVMVIQGQPKPSQSSETGQRDPELETATASGSKTEAA